MTVSRPFVPLGINSPLSLIAKWLKFGVAESMRSFWIRIFATFWVIEILTIAGLVTLTGRIDNAFTLHPLSEKALLLMAFSAEKAYQAGQCNELKPLFHRVEQVYRVTPYLFDGAGRGGCREQVPQPVQP